MNSKDSKSSWSSAVSMEKRELFEDRAENILLILKHRFPGIPQSGLDISKIQFNRDVGQAILESCSRIIENLAFTVLSRIEDVMHADSLARNPDAELEICPLKDHTVQEKFPNAQEELEKLNSSEAPSSMTLLDFMGWNMDQGETDTRKDSTNRIHRDADSDNLSKPINTNKKASYIEQLENLGGSRSPHARH